LTATSGVKRDTKVIGVVSLAHGCSHFYQLALPPLFPLIHAQEGYDYAELGVVVVALYLASALCQPAAGFLVDRFGARVMLLCGLAIQAGATVLIGVLPFYEALFVLAIAVGIGNSVFHPCDYSVMSATISEQRLGRAYSIHMLGGFIGYALAPAALTVLGTTWGWQSAIIAAGLAGFVILALVAAWSGDFRDSRHVRRTETLPETKFGEIIGSLFQGPILLCWLFFAIMAMAQIGLQSKSVSILSLPDTFAIDIETAGKILTAYLLATAVGVMCGGYIAERTHRHDTVVAVGYGIAAMLMLVLWRMTPAAETIFAIYIAVGIIYGLAFPSRDIIVRNATPKESSGKVFGFVYSGMDFGSLVTPAMFGWLIDIGASQSAFLCIAVLWILSILVLKASGAAASKRAPVGT
jgi:FSR family fosmidomycin resistance protein-like MFS transporter